MEKNNKRKEILKLLQENYEIETAQDLSKALKDMFKGALQEMMNAEFDSSLGYSKYDKKAQKTNGLISMHQHLKHGQKIGIQFALSSNSQIRLEK